MAVYIIVSVMHGHTNIKKRDSVFFSGVFSDFFFAICLFSLLRLTLANAKGGIRYCNETVLMLALKFLVHFKYPRSTTTFILNDSYFIIGGRKLIYRNIAVMQWRY